MNEQNVFTKNVDFAIFGVDVEDGEKFAGELLKKLEKNDVMMEIIGWGDESSNHLPIVKFSARSKEQLIAFGIDVYDVDEELVEEIFFC